MNQCIFAERPPINIMFYRNGPGVKKAVRRTVAAQGSKQLKSSVLKSSQAQGSARIDEVFWSVG